MKNHMHIMTAAAAAAAIALLAACSGGSPIAATLPSSAAAQNHDRLDLSRSGIDPAYFSAISAIRALESAPHHHPAVVKAPRDLFVSNSAGTVNVVYILANHTWQNTGSISNGIEDPDGDFVRRGSLYVTDYGKTDIAQYAPGASSPEFFYSTGMIDPIDVTVDAHGNVYEADNDAYGGNGFVNEYKQGVNAILASCSPGGDVEGAAVDTLGDVFISVNFAAGGSGIVEYSGGLGGCQGTKLGISLTYAGGMAIDEHGTLIVCDQGGTVDLIPAPYTSISGTLGSGYKGPYHVTINKNNSHVYVADPYGGDVRVLAYPSGTNIATLNSAQGLMFPEGAVDGHNYAP